MSATSSKFTLCLDSFHRLVAHFADGTDAVGVIPVCAFPLSAPDEGFALLDDTGHELVWIDSLSALAPNDQALFMKELAEREFMPEIIQVTDVSTYNLPSIWAVETDRGPCTLTLKALDSFGINYRIRDLTALDKKSRRILDHFL
jgi:hypothetical protein